MVAVAQVHQIAQIIQITQVILILVTLIIVAILIQELQTIIQQHKVLTVGSTLSNIFNLNSIFDFKKSS